MHAMTLPSSEYETLTTKSSVINAGSEPLGLFWDLQKPCGGQLFQKYGILKKIGQVVMNKKRHA